MNRSWTAAMRKSVAYLNYHLANLCALNRPRSKLNELAQMTWDGGNIQYIYIQGITWSTDKIGR